MKISNYRAVMDEETYVPYAVFEASISFETLYELQIMREDIRKDIMMTFGESLFEQIHELRTQSKSEDVK